MIRAEYGDLWDYEKTHLLVIPTNVGWTATGANVMGRGLAKQAADKYPDFPVWYGKVCRQFGSLTPVFRYPKAPLIAFPVKPLNIKSPWLSWKSGASLKLIESSAEALKLSAVELGWERVAVSLVGCGNGGLEMSEVRPILDRHLSDGRFVLVLKQ
jgi:hypothetical protein